MLLVSYYLLILLFSFMRGAQDELEKDQIMRKLLDIALMLQCPLKETLS